MRLSSVVPTYAVVGALLGYAVGSNSGHSILGIIGGFVVGGVFGAIGFYSKLKNQPPGQEIEAEDEEQRSGVITTYKLLNYRKG